MVIKTMTDDGCNLFLAKLFIKMAPHYLWFIFFETTSVFYAFSLNVEGSREATIIHSRPADKSMKLVLFYFSTKTNVVGAQKNHLSE